MWVKPYMLWHLLEGSLERFPEKTAVKHKERTISFQKLDEASWRMKAILAERGVKKGDRVGILLEKSIEQLIAMFGSSMAGSIFVFINPVLKKKQIEYILKDCDIKLLVTTKKHHAKNDLQIPETVLYMDERGEGEAGLFWPELQEQVSGRSHVEGTGEDIACLIYTSGSTGWPKGVVVPHRTLVEGARIVSSYLEITNKDVLLSVLPFNFDYGLNQATSSVMTGAGLVLHRFFLARDLLNVLERERITGFAGMNPIWVKVFDQRYAGEEEGRFDHLRYVTNSGGKVPRSIVEKMQRFFPKTKIYLMYGLTEAFRSTYLPPEELDRRPDSIGKAIPNVEIFAVNDRGEVCGPGDAGELVHRGALITRGYWNDKEQTEKVFRGNPMMKGQDHLNEVVVYSGDLVRMDEEGYFYFVSRRDEMIKTSGYRVSPTEVEEILLEIPGVRDTVVFGRELENGDQGIVAVVEPSNGEGDEKRMKQEAARRLPAYMVPHEMHLEKEFRKTANGKVDRSYLKKKWLGLEGENHESPNR